MTAPMNSVSQSRYPNLRITGRLVSLPGSKHVTPQPSLRKYIDSEDLGQRSLSKYNSDRVDLCGGLLAVESLKPIKGYVRNAFNKSIKHSSNKNIAAKSNTYSIPLIAGKSSFLAKSSKARLFKMSTQESNATNGQALKFSARNSSLPQLQISSQTKVARN